MDTYLYIYMYIYKILFICIYIKYYIVYIVKLHRLTMHWLIVDFVCLSRFELSMHPVKINRWNVYSTACTSLALYTGLTLLITGIDPPWLLFKWTLDKRSANEHVLSGAIERNRTIVAHESNCCLIRRVWLEFDENLSCIFTSIAELLPNRITLFT